jgi:hypothetical protein
LPVPRNAAGSTLYRDRIVTGMAWGYAVIAFVFLMGLAVSPIAPILRIAAGVLAVSYLSLTRFQWSRIGLEVRPDGVRVWGMLTRRFVPLAEIRSFTSDQGVSVRRVRVELTTGQTLRTGLVQGRKMHWHHGASKNIVTVLNTTLDHARTSAA